ALLLLAAASLPETRPPALRRPAGLRLHLRALGALGRERAFVGYAMTLGLSQAALFTYIAASPFVIEQLYGLSPQAFSALFAVNALGIVAGGQVSRLLVRRIGPGPLLRVALWLQVAGTGALVATGLAGRPQLVLLMVPLCVAVSTIGVVSPNATALAMAPFAAAAGSASAQLGAAQLLVGALLSPLSGLGGHRSIEPMAGLMCVLACAATLTYRVVVRPALAGQPTGETTATRS
nr:Bcr/CflA family drug resistance efflux transporter [Actinomycetota bacterium]